MSFDSALDPPPRPRQQTMTRKEACEFLGIGMARLMTAIRKGEIAATFKLGRWYVSRASVESVLKMDERAA